MWVIVSFPTPLPPYPDTPMHLLPWGHVVRRDRQGTALPTGPRRRPLGSFRNRLLTNGIRSDHDDRLTSGGPVITEAGADPHGAVLIYIAAHAPEEGETETADGKRFPIASRPLVKTPDGFVFLDPANFAADFAADLLLPLYAISMQ